ncbi:acyltransferase family protein [Streptosporangium sp. NPDC000239]|uniref:acyltransferase family protein n=1 Tax=Streptosporangium sp. NPDC000239 TaxID=3154248 RepID=UPI00332E9A96
MSDTRPSSPVPAPWDDGASGAGGGGQTGGQDGRAAPWPQPPAPDPAEGAGEVTAWGYPAYREPENTPGGETSTPYWEGSSAFGSEETSGAGAAPSAARQARSPYPSPHDPPHTTASQEPASQRPEAREPLPQRPGSRERDARWAQEFGAAQARAWTSGTPSEPPSSETFSYWENSARQQPEPQEADRRPSAWGEATVSPWEQAHPVPSQEPPAPAEQARYTAPAPAELPERTTPRRRGSRAASHLNARPRIPAYLDEHPQVTEQQRAPVPVGAHAAGPAVAPSSVRGPAALEWEQRAYAEEEPTAPPAKKKREPYLDNVKFVLIVMVVIGHSLVPTLAAHSSRAAYLFIYTFHMPAFVLISGYLGRNFWNSNAKINKLVDTMLVPYAFIEIGYALLRYALGQKWTLTIIDPAWLNWYLVALVLWRISTPIWTRMRQPLLVAVTIYMVAGFSEISGDFSLDRFFGLLPFYVLGLLLKPEHFDLLKPFWVRIAAGFVVAGGVAVAVYLAPRVGLDPVYYRYSFKYMHLSWWMGLSVRAAMLLAGLALSVALLALVPRRETWFSDLGTRTLYTYLLHGVVVLIAKDQKWLSFPWLYGPLGVLAIASSSLVLAIILSLPQTRTLFKWLLEPRLVWLYRRPSSKESSAAVPR